MLTAYRFLVPTFFAISLLLPSCTGSVDPNHSKEGVEAAMHQYDHYIKKLDADSIALLYTPDGDMGGKAQGRDSIRNYLSSFKGVEVLYQLSTSASIELIADTAIQKGTYHQTALIRGKDTSKASGEFTTYWLWIPKEGWRIKRMITKPS